MFWTIWAGHKRMIVSAVNSAIKSWRLYCYFFNFFYQIFYILDWNYKELNLVWCFSRWNSVNVHFLYWYAKIYIVVVTDDWINRNTQSYVTPFVVVLFVKFIISDSSNFNQSIAFSDSFHQKTYVVYYLFNK